MASGDCTSMASFWVRANTATTQTMPSKYCCIISRNTAVRPKPILSQRSYPSLRIPRVGMKSRLHSFDPAGGDFECNGLIYKRVCQEHFSPCAGCGGLVRDIQPISLWKTLV